jgi:hypothetical protein
MTLSFLPIRIFKSSGSGYFPGVDVEFMKHNHTSFGAAYRRTTFNFDGRITNQNPVKFTATAEVGHDTSAALTIRKSGSFNTRSRAASEN